MLTQTKKNLIVGSVITLLVAIVATVLAGLKTIDAGNVGVIKSFGAVNDRVLDEGLHVVMPWRDRVIDVDVTIQKKTVTVDATSKDLQQIDTTVTLNYNVDPAKANVVYQRFRGKHQDIFVKPSIEEAIKASTAKYTAEELIARRAAVKEDIENEMKSRLAPKHLVVIGVAVENFKFSRKFNAAIEAKMVAVQRALEEKNELERTKILAQQREAKAQGEAAAILAKAKAQAEAQRLVNETLTPMVLRKQMLDKWDGTVPLVVGDSQGSFLDVVEGAKMKTIQKRLVKRREAAKKAARKGTKSTTRKTAPRKQ